jgi:polyhydroxybutyrate depolymerase
MDAAADRHGFVAVHPNGTGGIAGKLLVWNAGTCCGRAPTQGIDDVGFLVRLLDALEARVPIDRARVYATGLSNGAMMAQRLAAEAAGRIAAVAPVAGSLVLVRMAPARAMPVMHVHSVDDPRALWGGGLGPPFPGTSSRVLHPAVEDSVGRRRTFDGCPDAPQIAPALTGADGHTATRLTWGPCRGGVEVVRSSSARRRRCSTRTRRCGGSSRASGRARRRGAARRRRATRQTSAGAPAAPRRRCPRR